MKEEPYNPKDEDIKELMDALEKIGNGDPDAQIPEGAKALLRSASEQLDEKNREFVSGNIMLNPEAFRVFRKIAVFLKNMKEAGMGEVDIMDYSPSLMPARIRFSTEELVLSGESLLEFASCVEMSSDLEIYPETDGRLRLDFGVREMWKGVDLGEEADK